MSLTLGYIHAVLCGKEKIVTDDECSRLKIALLFLELIIDLSEEQESAINDLAWAAHSYVQSVALDASLPDEAAQELYAKLQSANAIAEAKRNLL